MNAPSKLVEVASKLDDPHLDGWDTEAFTDAALKQIKRLIPLFGKPEGFTATAVQELVEPDFACDVLRSPELAFVHDDGRLLVRRALTRVPDERIAPHKGADGLAEALRSLAKAVPEGIEPHAWFKMFQVEVDGASVRTGVYFEITGRSETGSLQVTAVWHCRWRLPRGIAPPRLEWIGVEKHEEATYQGTGPTMLSDCTQSVLGANASFRDQLAHGLPHWTDRIEAAIGTNTFAHYGLAVGDVNGDGLDDVYVCQPGGLPNRLYVHNADGTATDRSAEAGVDWIDHTRSALLVDLDGDSDQDLVLGMSGAVVLMENDGTGRFAQRFQHPTSLDVHSMAAADFDGDGDLDIYITVDDADPFQVPGRGRQPVLYYDSNDGAPNTLLANKGDWVFADVTEASGMDRNNRRHSMACAWEDFDNDGDPDLYVANDFGKNCLYRNDGGQFTEIAGDTGAEDPASGMSVSWGDYDRDGRVDLYVGNMWSSAGSRIVPQSRFQPETGREIRAAYHRFAKGNSLFHNDAGGFQDVSFEASVTMGRWAWSSLFVDLNNDGWDDIVIANGYLTAEDSHDL